MTHGSLRGSAARTLPKNDERRADDGRPEHYLQGNKGLIPAGREPGQLRLHELQLHHDLREVITGFGGLPEGEAFGIEVIGHAPITNLSVANGRFTASAPS